MALIPCPECGHRVSTAAPACPDCGYPVAASLTAAPVPPAAAAPRPAFANAPAAPAAPAASPAAAPAPDGPDRDQSKARVARFSHYLVQVRKAVPRPHLERALKFLLNMDRRFGQVAILEGMLTPADVLRIVARQVNEPLRFGELALAEKRLTAEQVGRLLDVQRDLFLLFTHALVLSRAVSKVLLPRLLEEFQQAPAGDATGGAGGDAGAVDPQLRQSLAAPLGALKSDPALFDRERLRHNLQQLKSLSALPQIVHRLMNMLADPHVNLSEVARLIQSDPALSSRMLRLVNSAFYARLHKIGNIGLATVTLGTAGVRKCVLTATVMDKMLLGRAKEVKALWHHAALAGQWAQAILQERGERGELLEDGFMAGMLHDIGKIAVLQHFPKARAEIVALTDRGIPEPDAERAVLTGSHAEIGAFLCLFWQLPPELAQAAHYHHAPPAILENLSTRSPLTDAVNAGCRLANLSRAADGWSAGEIGVEGLDDDFLEYHRLTREGIQARAREVQKHAREFVAAIH